MLVLCIGLVAGAHRSAIHNLSAQTSNADLPRIELNETRRNLGSLNCGSSHRATFRVRNIGQQRLILSDSRTSCECVSSTDQQIIVPPGKEGQVTVEMDTSKLSGSMELNVQYHTNDPVCPLVTFSLLADIVSTASSD